MNKFTKVLLPITATALLFVGCGGSDNNELIVQGLYSGYAEDANSNKVSLQIIASDSSVAQVVDFNDNQSVLASSEYSNTLIAFSGYECKQSGANLLCNGYVLEPVTLDTLTLASLDGNYKRVDSSNTTWSMTIDSGRVSIFNDLDACTLNGTASLSLDESVPTFSLTASDCPVDGVFNGFAERTTVSTFNDTINLLIPNYTTISSNWTK